MSQATQPILQSTPSGVSFVLILLMWVAWLAVLLVADLFAFLMFAFADSPGSATSAKLMIVPVFCWFVITFVAGGLLLIFKGPWQIPLAFVLAISPPFLVFLGYNLLSGVTARPTPIMPATVVTTTYTPPAMQTPPGRFAPTFTPPQQPDWRAATRPTTNANDR